MRGAIFDLDGTLADTAGDLLQAANAVLGPCGLPALDPVADRPYAGRGGKEMIRRSITLAGRDPMAGPEHALTERLYPQLLEAYEAGLANETRLYDGVVACLDQIEAEGWQIGVCTNKPERLACMLLDRLGLGTRFAAILGADSLAVRKPDPEHFRVTCHRIGVDPHAAIMIGDTRTDRDTAAAAGVPCVLTRFGFSDIPPEELCPDAIVDHFNEIPGVLAHLSAKHRAAHGS